jgi:hypothetical protein
MNEDVGGEGDRQTIVRPRSPRFAGVFRKLDFAGIFLHLCLSSPAVVRYNPAQLLGHMLGQRRRGDGAENQPVERAGGGDD